MYASIIRNIAYILVILIPLIVLIASIVTYNIGKKTKKKYIVLIISIVVFVLSIVSDLALWKTENIALMKSQREIKNKTKWVQILSEFKDVKVIIENIRDIEAARFAADIRGMIYSAKLETIDKPPEIALDYLDGVFIEHKVGTFFEMDKMNALTDTLLACFKESGVKAVGSPGCDKTPTTIIIKIAYNPIIPRKGFHILIINPKQGNDSTLKNILKETSHD